MSIKIACGMTEIQVDGENNLNRVDLYLRSTGAVNQFSLEGNTGADIAKVLPNKIAIIKACYESSHEMLRSLSRILDVAKKNPSTRFRVLG